jgi:hypothetical protein
MSPINDPALREAILLEFVSGVHPAHIVRNRGITLIDLLDWWNLPDVQATIARLRELLEAQRLLTTLAAASECTAILMNVARQAPGTETARKAAAQLLRSLGPASKQPAPRAAATEQPAQQPTAHHLNKTAPPPPPPDTFPIESFRAHPHAEPLTEPRRAPERLACHDS